MASEIEALAHIFHRLQVQGGLLREGGQAVPKSIASVFGMMIILIPPCRADTPLLVGRAAERATDSVAAKRQIGVRLRSSARVHVAPGLLTPALLSVRAGQAEPGPRPSDDTSEGGW